MSHGEVFITGASGFVGRETVKRFLAGGWQVRAAVRSVAECAIERDAHLSIVEAGDITLVTDWAPLLAGCNVVVHLAARAHQTSEAPDAAADLFQRTNVDVSVRLIRGAAAAGVQRFVFVSSAGVMGDFSERPFTEADPPRPKSEYAKSKWQAEQALGKIARETGIELVILRPTLVYGPGNPGNLDRLIRLIRTGLPLPLGAVRNRRSFLNVGHLAGIVCSAAQLPEAAGKTVLLADGNDLSIPDLVRTLAEGMGARARLFAVPPSLVLLGGRMLGRSRDVERLLGSLEVDVALKTSLFGAFPRAETMRGLIEAGRAKRT
jgi:nucleoside-diphosphate-sugar epimerase